MTLETGIDKLLDLVNEKKEITVSEAAKKLGVPEKNIESWAKVMSDENMLELVYPANPLNQPFLRVYSKEQAKKKPEKVEEPKKEEKKKEKREPKKPEHKAARNTKSTSSRFFSRFRKTAKKQRSRTPYIIFALAIVLIILYLTGVIGWLISLLSPSQ